METVKKDKPTKTASGKDIVQAPGTNQFLVEKGMAFSEIVQADADGKMLVFDVLDFPEISRTNLAKLSNRARMAYQMDLRNAGPISDRLAKGDDPFESRIQVINDRDPLARSTGSLRKGQAKKVPDGMKHLNVGPHEVAELEEVGWRKAKPSEVDIVGAKEKAGAVVLMDNKGKVDNVTMLVEKEAYDKHRKADRERAEARLTANVQQTKEKMKQFDSRVTIFDKSDLVRK